MNPFYHSAWLIYIQENLHSLLDLNCYLSTFKTDLDQQLQVVESPVDSALIPDGAALSAFQYFENVRNFLVAAQELGIPSFEASDLEQVSIVP